MTCRGMVEIRVRPSEFELIKNRAAIVKVRAALDWHVLWVE